MLHLSAKRHRFIICWEDAQRKTFWATTWRTYYSIWFIGWVSPYNCEWSVPNPSIWKKVLPWLFLGYALYAEWIWKGDILVADLEELETMDASEIYSKRLNPKEVIFPKQGESIFPIADGRIKALGGDQDLWTPTLIRDHSIRAESHLNFLGESEGSLPPLHDLFPDAGEAMNDFWFMSGSFIYRHLVESRVKLYSPREESFPSSTELHWRFQNYTYEFGCQARETLRWLLAYRWILRLVWSLDRFHTIYFAERKNSRWINVVRCEINEKNSLHPGQII